MAINKFKATSIALAIIGMGAAFAFTSNSNTFAEGEKWFEFVGTNPADSSHYTLVGDMPPTCPEGEDERCAIFAQPSVSQPSLPDLSTITQERLRADE